MKDLQFSDFLNMITEEVLAQVAEKQSASSAAAAAAARAEDACTAVLVPSAVPFKEKALEALTKSFGDSLVFISFDGTFRVEGFRVICPDEMNRDEILGVLEKSINVVLLAPMLTLIRKIAEAEDAEFPVYLFIRAQLWGRKVSVYLDFELPRRMKAGQREHVSDALNALNALDIPMVYYLENERDEPVSGLTLITEEDVLTEWRAGKKEIACRKDAIITPLASDKAGELGLIIRRAGEVI